MQSIVLVCHGDFWPALILLYIEHAVDPVGQTKTRGIDICGFLSS